MQMAMSSHHNCYITLMYICMYVCAKYFYKFYLYSIVIIKCFVSWLLQTNNEKLAAANLFMTSWKYLVLSVLIFTWATLFNKTSFFYLPSDCWHHDSDQIAYRALHLRSLLVVLFRGSAWHRSYHNWFIEGKVWYEYSFMFQTLQLMFDMEYRLCPLITLKRLIIYARAKLTVICLICPTQIMFSQISLFCSISKFFIP